MNKKKTNGKSTIIEGAIKDKGILTKAQFEKLAGKKSTPKKKK